MKVNADAIMALSGAAQENRENFLKLNRLFLGGETSPAKGSVLIALSNFSNPAPLLAIFFARWQTQVTLQFQAALSTTSKLNTSNPATVLPLPEAARPFAAVQLPYLYSAAGSSGVGILTITAAGIITFAPAPGGAWTSAGQAGIAANALTYLGN